MPRMSEDDLLKHLQINEDDAAQYTDMLGAFRRASLAEYYRDPYGNEEEGWSQIVTSEVQDTVEWILPELLDIFTSSDEAVVFEPTRAEDVQGAEQATDTCNYIFHKQNNGFLTLYTAFKDALTVKNCAVMWRTETVEERRTEQAQGVTPEILALIHAEDGLEIEAAIERQVPVPGPDGQPLIDPMTQQPVTTTVYDVNLARTEKRTRIKVEAFAPEQLFVKRDWTSPLLDDCPYVCRVIEVTLSDLKQMGFDDVTAADLRSSDDPWPNGDEWDYRRSRIDGMRAEDENLDQEDESQATGYLRIEFALVDFDGDGIAERRCIYRLSSRVLSNEECSHVQIATTSPILNTHRWDGMSIAEAVSDIQRLKTDLTRALVNGAHLSVNPRKTVLTDSSGNPMVDVDDLLDYRVGGFVRTKNMDAIRVEPTAFNPAQSIPVLDYIDQMAEKRTGVSKQQQGLDPNSLRPDRTAAEVMMTANAAKQRVKLIARIFGETLVKPIFKGIFKLLTDGQMQPIAFRLRGEFVQYDPNEWRDQYDMTINVGLGTGDKQQQAAMLQSLSQMQMGLAQSPFGQLMIQPQNIYNSLSKYIEAIGFKNVGDFVMDPQGKPLPPPPPPPQLAMEQQKLQQQGQMKQMELQAKAQADEMQRRQQAELELIRQRAQQETDANRRTMEAQMHQMKLAQEAELNAMRAQYEDVRHAREMEFQRWKAELDASVKIESANISSKAKVDNPATQTATAEISREVQP